MPEEHGVILQSGAVFGERKRQTEHRLHGFGVKRAVGSAAELHIAQQCAGAAGGHAAKTVVFMDVVDAHVSFDHQQELVELFERAGEKFTLLEAEQPHDRRRGLKQLLVCLIDRPQTGCVANFLHENASFFLYCAICHKQMQEKSV